MDLLRFRVLCLRGDTLTHEREKWMAVVVVEGQSIIMYGCGDGARGCYRYYISVQFTDSFRRIRVIAQTKAIWKFR